MSMFTPTLKPNGYALIRFSDANGTACFMLEGAGSKDTLFIGPVNVDATVLCRDAEKVGLTPEGSVGHQTYPIPEGVYLHGKVELTREMAEELIPVLQRFVATGRIVESEI